jgi:hypothetical protein
VSAVRHGTGFGRLMASRVWISSEDAAAVAEKGFRIVQAPSNYFYLVGLPLMLQVVLCMPRSHITYNSRIVVLVNGLEMIRPGKHLE